MIKKRAARTENASGRCESSQGLAFAKKGPALRRTCRKQGFVTSLTGRPENGQNLGASANGALFFSVPKPRPFFRGFAPGRRKDPKLGLFFLKKGD